MNLYKIPKYIIWDIVGIILFKIVLDYSYISFIVPIYDYMGFTLDFNIIKYIEGWGIYIILYLLLIKNKNHVLYMGLLISFLLLIPPTITLYSFKNEPSAFFYSMIIPYAIMLLFISTKKVKLYYVSHSKMIAIIVSILVVFIVFLHYFTTVGLNHINFDLSKVYELRRSKVGIESNEGIFGYLNSWTTKVFNIFLIAIALLNKKYFLVSLLVIVQITIFGFSGHKEVLFSLLLIFGLFFFDKVKHSSTIIIYSFIIFIILLLIYFQVFNEPMLPSILIRRVFFVPSHLNYVYFEYFSSHEYIYWSNSILKNFIDYPYSVAPVFVIGGYLGYPNMAANTGIFGSGYMQLGLIGIIIYVLILTLLINLVNQFNKLPLWFINAILLMPMLTIFISSDLLTSLLTHGFLVAIIILYLYSSGLNQMKRNI